MEHDNCYGANGLSAGSNLLAFQHNNLLKQCNVQLCRSAQAVITNLTQPGEVLTSSQAAELRAAEQINFYFTWAPTDSNGCHP
jgi:hypothetical protein